MQCFCLSAFKRRCLLVYIHQRETWLCNLVFVNSAASVMVIHTRLIALKSSEKVLNKCQYVYIS